MVVEWHVLLLALLCCSVAQQSVETKQVDNRSAKVCWPGHKIRINSKHWFQWVSTRLLAVMSSHRLHVQVYHAVPGGDHAVRRFIGRRHVRAAEIVCKDCQACTDCNLSTSGGYCGWSYRHWKGTSVQCIAWHC